MKNVFAGGRRNKARKTPPNWWFGLIVVLLAATGAAGYDYRLSAENQSPQSFERSLSLTALYPNSVTIFSRGHNASWVLSDVSDFTVDSNGLAAVMHKDLIYLPEAAGGDYLNGVCGGLVVSGNPAGNYELQRHGDHLIVSDDDLHMLYYIPDCGWYNRVPKNGYKVALDEEYICEASFDEYTIRNIIGATVYTGEAAETPVAAYSHSGKCYYLGSKGTLTQIDPVYGAADTLFETGFTVTAAQPVDTGLMAMTSAGYLTIRFDPNNAIQVDYHSLPSGTCMMAAGSSEPFCAEEYPDLFDEAVEADKTAVTQSGIYILNEGRLTAYEASQSWVKSIITPFEMPSACTEGDALYYLDLRGLIWHVDLLNSRVEKVTDFPDDCKMTVFRSGAFYSFENELLYKYADLVAQEGDKLLYKRDQGDTVYYFTVRE